MKIDEIDAAQLKKTLIKRLREIKKQRVIIKSAYPLGAEELKLFVAELPQLREKELINEVRPELLGGFIIEDDEGVIDLSILGSLQSFQA